jgi:putative toxin-antitoxin system antitoxin component (TIGR02293 family)
MPEQSQVAEETGRETVINRAIEVIGVKSEALRWLGTPVPALGYATPISLLENPQGQATVMSVLTKLEHGVL